MNVVTDKPVATVKVQGPEPSGVAHYYAIFRRWRSVFWGFVLTIALLVGFLFVIVASTSEHWSIPRSAMTESGIATGGGTTWGPTTVLSTQVNDYLQIYYTA